MNHTPVPWTAHRMVLEDGTPPTPEQIGEYVTNSVRKSAEESGTIDFLIVTCEKPDGPADVCHVGNGPNGPWNAKLIEAAPDLLAACEVALKILDGMPVQYSAAVEQLYAAIAKAKGEDNG